MDDTDIINLLFARDQKGISHLTQKYGKLIFSTSNNILHSQEDARECTNDTYLAIWNTIPPNRPSRLVSFVCKIARNLSLKKLREKTAAKRNSITVPIDEFEEILPGESAENILDAELLGQKIDSFLDTVSEENRAIFIKRYWFCDEISDIAEQLGISENNVYTKLSRTRKRLRTHLEKEGIAI